MDTDKRAIVRSVVALVISQVTVYYGLKYVLNMLDPNRDRRQQTKEKSSAVLRRLQETQSEDGVEIERETLELNEYEQIIATEVIIGDEIKASFDDIGGLDNIISELRESVILPLTNPELFQFPGVNLSAPKGVLLHGPPGCGKTMLAKALAAESGATFINVHLSTLTDKWFGESNKLIAALFSIARKLQPTIVFIDEIDSFLRERQKSDHEAMAMIKAEFMSSWDGLTTSDDTRIIIMGATNRREDIDPAILRRMPKQFQVQLPNEGQRRNILTLLLKENELSESLDLGILAKATKGLSGSGLKELCRSAASIPHREFIRQYAAIEGSKSGKLDKQKLKQLGVRKLRPLEFRDFVESAKTVGSGAGLNGFGVDVQQTMQSLFDSCD